MSWIFTLSGHRVDYLNPTVDQIDINDIALALSRESRFNGHTSKFYSVAQHCVHVSKLVPKELALEALLHDATEAYMKDIPSPLKMLLPDYRAIETRLYETICTKWFLPFTMSYEVKNADALALEAEKRSFTKDRVVPSPIIALTSANAMRLFLKRFKEIQDVRLQSLRKV